MKNTEITQELVAEKFLWGLWRSIDADYKTKYARDVWEHFENAIRSAAYTSDLKNFLSLFQRRIPTDIQAKYIKDIKSIIDMGEDETVLDWMRTESTYMMMLVRLANQNFKEEYLERMATEKEIEKMDFSKPHDLD